MNNLIRISAIFTLLAGVSHALVQSYSHFGMHFYFVSFLLLGLIQIILGVILWRQQISSELFWMATLVNGGAIIFWLLTRTMVAPFMGGVEHFSVLSGMVVSLEVLSILLLCIEQKKLLRVVYVLFGSMALGFSSHFGAMSLETYFPELKGTGVHYGGGHYATMSAEEHLNMMNHQEKNTESDDHNKPHGH